MNAIYIEMTSSDHRMSLPVELDMRNKQCALFEATGTVVPYMKKPLFLCSDFIESSIVGERMIPVLRRIQLMPDEEDEQDDDGDDAKKKGKVRTSGIVDHIFHKMLWMSTNRDEVDEIRVYISDETGKTVTFSSCDLSCTLVSIPSLQ